MKTVNAIIGRFQPLTKADQSLVETMRINGLDTVAVYIRSHQGYGNTPFKSKTVKRSLVESGLFCDVMYADTWTVEDIKRVLEKKGYQVAKLEYSDHNSLRSTCARVSLLTGDKESFKKMVPENVAEMYTEMLDQISEYCSDC